MWKHREALRNGNLDNPYNSNYISDPYLSQISCQEYLSLFYNKNKFITCSSEENKKHELLFKWAVVHFLPEINNHIKLESSNLSSMQEIIKINQDFIQAHWEKFIEFVQLDSHSNTVMLLKDSPLIDRMKKYLDAQLSIRSNIESSQESLLSLLPSRYQ